MLEAPLRALAVLASLLVIAGWGLFAIDQAGDATAATQEQLAGDEAATRVDPSPEQERAREAANGGPRELVDDAGDVLLAPFGPLVADSGSQWVRRSVPAVLALLLYGAGLGYLASFARSG